MKEAFYAALLAKFVFAGSAVLMGTLLYKAHKHGKKKG